MRRLAHTGALVATSVVVLCIGVRGTQDAVANGDTRTITIKHMHTKEETTVTFRRDGRYDSAALEKLNWAMRDWRTDEPIRMDPRLFDLAWEVHRKVGSEEPFHVVSAYRSPGTNSMLRRRSRGVAKSSQHMVGKAMDFYLPDVGMDRVRSIAMRLQRGGVGYYPTAFNPFVHLDAGSVRAWPRMTRDQLARLFPDGRTVHIPTDGRPMPGFEQARAEILAAGGSVFGSAASYADAGEAAQPTRRKSLWATLFGGGSDDEDEDQEYVRPQRGGRTTVAARGPQQPVNPASSSSDSPVAFLLRDRQGASEPTPQRPVAVAALPKPAAEPAPPPTPAAPPVVAQAPAAEPAPLPTARPAELAPGGPVALAAAQPAASGPRFVWQQGPSGSGSEPGATVAALVPLPPRRPGELAAAPQEIFANVPLPPARPVALASLGAATPGAAGAAPAHGDALTALAAAAASTAGGDNAPAALMSAYAPVDHPSPPARPVAFAALRPSSEPPVEAQARAPAQAEIVTTASIPQAERTALKALFSTASTASAPPVRTPVATSRARVTANLLDRIATTPPTRTVVAGFSKGPATTPASGLSVDHFTGPAVQPVATVTFAKR